MNNGTIARDIESDLQGELRGSIEIDKLQGPLCDHVNALSRAFRNDPDLAYTWHCNIAMAMFDAFGDNSGLDYSQTHSIANEGASRFMKSAFNVDTP